MRLLVLCVAGGVDATPAVGISPANADTDRTHVRIAFTLAAIFGWSDIRMAMRYTHAMEDAERRAVEALAVGALTCRLLSHKLTYERCADRS